MPVVTILTISVPKNPFFAGTLNNGFTRSPRFNDLDPVHVKTRDSNDIAVIPVIEYTINNASIS